MEGLPEEDPEGDADTENLFPAVEPPVGLGEEPRGEAGTEELLQLLGSGGGDARAGFVQGGFGGEWNLPKRSAVINMVVSVVIQMTLTNNLLSANFTRNMKPSTRSAVLALLGTPPPAYRRLQHQLRRTAWICQGTVVARSLIRHIRGRTVKKGPYYLWTCKVKGRTVCLALAKAQYRALAQAIANHRRLQSTLEQMQTLTLKTILKKVPGVRKRK